MSQEALQMMWALRLEDGRRWGEVAADFQIEDAAAIFSPERPNKHFLTRGRGGSKSTDIAGAGLSWLTMDALPLANGHIVASSTDQASIVVDAAHGLIARTPELEGQLVVETQRIVAPNGAWIRVLAQSDSGAWGLRDAHFLVCDEFCQWPETRGAQRVWAAIHSAVPKVPGCKLIILSSAGEPSHWSKAVIDKCYLDPLWRVHEVPGPVPWLDAEELESLRWSLTPAQYARLVLNLWEEDEDRAIGEDDWDYAAQPYKELAPQKGVKYVMTVDIGILNDRTAISIQHKESIDPENRRGPQRVVVDKLERWQGSRKKPVQLSHVENWIVVNAPKWNRCEVHADPSQFMGNIQSLNRRGVRAKEFPFTATTVGEVAASLVQSFRNRQIYVPDDPILKDELLKVRLRESTPGVTRLDHDPGSHDDQAIVIGMGCRLLLGKMSGGIGADFRAFMEADTAKRLERVREDRLARDQKSRIERTITDNRERAHRKVARQKQECVHRWSPDRSYCMFCFKIAEPVVPIDTLQLQ